jgi:hypothetical protein
MDRGARALREKLGDEAMADLRVVIDNAGRQWREDVLSVSAERFERRLAEEIGALRIDMAKEFAAIRVEMASLAWSTRADVLKWSFLFWIGQFAAITGMMAFLLKTMVAR